MEWKTRRGRFEMMDNPEKTDSIETAEVLAVIEAKDDIILGRGDLIEELKAHIKRLKARVRKNTSYAHAFYKYDGEEGRWVRRP